MKRIQRAGTPTYFSALSALALALWVTACGVEVGNPSEPTPTVPKGKTDTTGSTTVPGLPDISVDNVNPVEPSEPVKMDVRYLVENQYDEAITAALDFAFDNTTVSLALAGTDTRACGVLPDGSLSLNHQETNSETRTTGTDADATAVTESYSRVFSSNMASPGLTLACNTGGTKPKLDWSNVSNVTIKGMLDRTNSRNIVTMPQQAFVRSSSVKSTGEHTAEVKKTKFDANSGLSLTRQLSFGTDMEIKNQTAVGASSTLNTRIETAAGEALAIEEQYNTSSALKSLKIVSGTVSSKKQDDGLVVIMRYSNVLLSADGDCKPKSGMVTGEIRLPSDPNTIYEKFSILFKSDDNLIVYGDGTSSKLEFEPCRIEVEKADTDNNNSRGGGRNNGR